MGLSVVLFVCFVSGTLFISRIVTNDSEFKFVVLYCLILQEGAMNLLLVLINN